MADIWTIIYGAILGGVTAYGLFKNGQLGQSGETIFNWTKGIFCIIVGGLFGFFLSYSGQVVDANNLLALFAFITPMGIGVVGVIDLVAAYVAKWLGSKTGLARSMAMPKTT